MNVIMLIQLKQGQTALLHTKKPILHWVQSNKSQFAPVAIIDEIISPIQIVKF